MTDLRPEEVWVQECVEAALPGVRAEHHDDGSQSSMYDFNLLRNGVAFGALEVTAAADPELIELWNLVNGTEELWTEPRLDGGWMVTLSRRARAKTLRAGLPALLRRLEGEARAWTGSGMGGLDLIAARKAMSDLGVVSLSQTGTSHVGSIYLTVEPETERDGSLIVEGPGLSGWLGNWIDEESQRHNLDKLRGSGRAEQHLYILLPGFSSAPHDVVLTMLRDGAALPTDPVALPDGLTDVWLASAWTSGDIFHFNSAGWTRHSKV